jgi:pyruvate/2-oxoglutarate dehydrogenase complex dihydrolipoamide dehydrogenase (E3) component
MDEEADVVVLGMGPGGEAVATRLAHAGLDVVGVEPELVGGECAYWGCVPTKMMVRAADLLAESARAVAAAGSTGAGSDWAPVARRVRGGTDDWNDAVAVRRFGQSGGRLRRGRGRLDGPGRVDVDGVTVRARRGVVLATGCRPVIPPVPGLADTPFWTNRDAVAAVAVPGSLVVLGGGSIGVELGQVFARFGSDVTIVEAAPRVLGAEEPEASTRVAAALVADGIDLRLGTGITSAYHDGERFTMVGDTGDALSADRLLVATGRRADVGALGLGSVHPDLDLDADARAVPVDDRCRVRGVDGLWAVGDVTGEGAFTHVAVHQAEIAARDILGQEGGAVDYRAVPRVTFTDPEVGTVGLTEQEARERGRTIRVGTTELSASTRGWIHGPGGEGIIKVVEDADRGVLVGATSVGPTGGEVLGLLALAVHAEVQVGRLLDMITAYPTFHRAVQDAVRDLSAV